MSDPINLHYFQISMLAYFSFASSGHFENLMSVIPSILVKFQKGDHQKVIIHAKLKLPTSQ